MYELGVVYRNIHRTDKDIAEKLGQFGSATVHEAMGRVGLMATYMRPINASSHVSGTAVTVLLHPGDNWMMHVVAEQFSRVTSLWLRARPPAPTASLVTCWPPVSCRAEPRHWSSMGACATPKT